jgi:LacI family transcriptional regulator
MSDVAKAAKVHQTTVSLALRNDPRLPRETRARIQAVAESLGYRPDPMLSALSMYRASRVRATAQPSMAILMRSRNNRTDTFFADDQFLKGARAACERMGYRLTVFSVGSGAGEGARLSRVLRSRGIGGVILGSLDINTREFEMEWDDFCAICIETHHLGLSLHTVGNNQVSITRAAVRKAFELGYRRIGLAVGLVEEFSLRKPFTMGYLVEVHEHKGLAKLPPLLLRSNETPVTVKRLGAWLKRHRIDAILSNWSTMPDLLRAAGYKVPGDMRVATLDYNPHRGVFAGMRQSHEIVGGRAVEALSLLMKTHQRGPIRLPNVTLVDGCWQDGPEMPPKRRASGEP